MALLSDAFRLFRAGVAGPAAKQGFLKEAADMRADRVAEYDRADQYYRGEHRVKLTAREKEYLQASGLPYAENFCETIVDTHASRLTVSGFGSDQPAMGDFARELWESNDLDDRQFLVHEGLVKLGDYFVIVEAEEGRLPCLYPNDPRHVKCVYDSGEMLYASKVWSTARESAINPQGRKIRRLNVYWPDSIEKYWTASSDDDVWGPFTQGEDDEGHIDFWTMDGTPYGEPIGIPVIHFANKPSPFYGRSQLRGVIPQQDALNKSLVDLFWVMDAQGWPQQWGTGVSASDIKRHPGSLFTTEKEEARFGQLDAADPEKSILAIESQLKRMASRSHTPLHEMLAGGNLPSGETLKTSESGLVYISKRRQTGGGGKWRNAVRIAARAEVAFGGSEPPLDAKLATRWEKAESRQEVDEANVAVLWQTLGVSRDTILSRLGFDPEEERLKLEAEGPSVADELLARAQEMAQAPIRSEELGGGAQPAQNPANRVVR